MLIVYTAVVLALFLVLQATVVLNQAPKVFAAGGCKLASYAAACNPVSDWGGVDPNAMVQSAAQANPGQQFMAWCDANTGQASAITGHLGDCSCPGLSPNGNGGMVTGTCGACGNPTALYTTPIVTPPPPTNPPPPAKKPGINVEKVALNGPGPYVIGDPVPFRIRITNTGQTTFTSVVFNDTYNPVYLDFVNITGHKTNGIEKELTSLATVNELGGTIYIKNLAAKAALGALGPKQQYILTVNFIAKAPIDITCNDVVVKAGTVSDNGEACVGVNNANTDL